MGNNASAPSRRDAKRAKGCNPKPDESAPTEVATSDDEGSGSAKPAVPGRFSLDYLIVIVGFGLCRAWIVFSLSASVASLESRTDWVFLVAGAVAAALAALVMTRIVGSLARMHERLTEIMLGMVASSALCVPAAVWLDSPSLLLLGLITGGAASGLLQVMWGERFAAQDLYFSLACAPAAAIVTGLVLAMSSETNQLVFIALPIISVALLALECKRCNIVWKTGLPEGQLEDDEPEPTAAAASQPAAPRERMRLDAMSGKLMVTIMVFSFLVRMFDAFPIVGDDPFDLFGGIGSFSLVLVGAIFLIIAFFIKDRMNISLVYRLSLPIMIAGLIAIALVFGQRAPLSVMLIAIGYELFDILSWVLFSEVARRKGPDAAPYVFGIGVAYMFVGMAAGYLASAVMSPLVQDGSLQLSAVALVAILCLVVISFMVLPESVVSSLSHLGTSKKQEKEKPADQAEPHEPQLTLEQKCAGVAAQCGLTPRENEVLEFLARGRTLSIVARDLHIAKNTARTHIEKIYQKTGIHKQQDLIDFVEEWTSDEGDAAPQR